MRLDPLRPITDEEVKRFREQGFVHLHGVLPTDSVERLRLLLNRELEKFDPRSSHSIDNSERAAAILRSGGKVLLQEGTISGRSLSVRNVCRRNPDFLAFAARSPLPAIASALCGSAAIRFYNDQLFFKEPGSRIRTAFHSDADYFNVQGEQLVVLWVSVDPVLHSTGAMGYVPRSHLWGPFRPRDFTTGESLPDSRGPDLPDIEADEETYGVVYVEANPGDVIAHHYRTLHGSKGNISEDVGRSAASLRYAGSDIVYCYKPGSPHARRRAPLAADGGPLDDVRHPWVLGESFDV